MPFIKRLQSSRKRYVIILFSLLLASVGLSQSNVSEIEIQGTWIADIDDSRLNSMDALFLGSSITFNSDYTFAAKILDDLSGSWELKEGKIILNTKENIPSPIIFIELTAKSILWRIDKVDARIPFYKSGTNSSQLDSSNTQDYKSPDNIEIAGDWINTQIEDMSLSEKQNSILFGKSAANDRLFLGNDGQFSMFRGEICNNDNTCFVKGSWSVAEGLITLEWKSGKIEKLGIEKFTEDSLVLVDLEKRYVPFRGDVKIRFTHTKETAIEWRKFLIQPMESDTFYSNAIGIVINAPKRELYFGNTYSIEHFPVLSFKLRHCTNCINKEEKIESVKKELMQDQMFVRFLETKDPDCILYESQSKATNRAEYNMMNVFSHNGEIYFIETSSILSENLNIILESINNKEVINIINR